MSEIVYGFADGENLVARYEDMLRDGRVPKPGVVHVPGVVVWHPNITRHILCKITRLGFYQTAVGDTERVYTVKELISNVTYEYDDGDGIPGQGNLHPKVFKKESRQTTTKSVDINITVDVLRAAMHANGHGDVIMLLSGDGDYLPLVEEVMRHGKLVWLCAFSKGFNKHLKFAADDFFDLDAIFFEPLSGGRKDGSDEPTGEEQTPAMAKKRGHPPRQSGRRPV
jgi:uncharacterized LabA/DUF88 family protein